MFEYSKEMRIKLETMQWCTDGSLGSANIVAALPKVISVKNKAGYTATLVACGWAGAVMEKVTGAFGQEQ